MSRSSSAGTSAFVDAPSCVGLCDRDVAAAATAALPACDCSMCRVSGSGDGLSPRSPACAAWASGALALVVALPEAVPLRAPSVRDDPGRFFRCFAALRWRRRWPSVVSRGIGLSAHPPDGPQGDCTDDQSVVRPILSVRTCPTLSDLVCPVLSVRFLGHDQAHGCSLVVCEHHLVICQVVVHPWRRFGLGCHHGRGVLLENLAGRTAASVAGGGAPRLLPTASGHREPALAVTGVFSACRRSRKGGTAERFRRSPRRSSP